MTRAGRDAKTIFRRTLRAALAPPVLETTGDADRIAGLVMAYLGWCRCDSGKSWMRRAANATADNPLTIRRRVRRIVQEALAMPDAEWCEMHADHPRTVAYGTACRIAEVLNRFVNVERPTRRPRERIKMQSYGPNDPLPRLED